MFNRKLKLSLSLLGFVPIMFWFIFLILGPLIYIAINSFWWRNSYGGIDTEWTFANYQRLWDPLYLKIFLRTLIFATINTLLCLLLAYPAAYLITRVRNYWRTIFLTAILFPFWTSFLIRLLAYMEFLRDLRLWGLDILYHPMGIIGAFVYNYLPFALLPLYSSLDKIPNETLHAAADLGANAWQRFHYILWPLSRSGVWTAALFVFIPSLGEYLIPELVGGGSQFLLGSFLHNQYLGARNWPLGSSAIILLVASTIFLLFVAQRKNHLELGSRELL